MNARVATLSALPSGFEVLGAESKQTNVHGVLRLRAAVASLRSAQVTN